jgi:hypothetical protein
MIPFTWKPTYTYFAGGIVLLLSLFFAVNRVTSWWKDRAFEKDIQRYEEKLKVEAEISTAAKARADLWEARAKEAETQVVINELAVESAGKKADAIKERLENEDKQFTEALRAVDLNLSRCARILHICETAQRLGYRSKSQPCICTDE